MASKSVDSKKYEPAWKYATAVDGARREKVRYNFCDKVLSGGVFRMKEHWIGGRRNAAKCHKAPVEVKKEMEEYIENRKKQREDEYAKVAALDLDLESESSMDDIQMSNKTPKSTAASTPSLQSKSKGSKMKGPLVLYMTPETAVMRRKGKGQMKIDENDPVRKELRARACTAFARWMYDAGIPFNAVNYDSFPVVVEAFGQYGPNMKPPSYHEVRVPLLKKEVEHTKKIISEHEQQWEKFVFSLMCDGWTDGVQRSLINFLANSPKGSVFIESVDSSAYAKTREKIYELLCGYIEKLGPSNILQVVTDSASNNKLAGKL